MVALLLPALLQARSTASGAWVDLEAGGGAVLVVLAAEQLELASGGAPICRKAVLFYRIVHLAIVGQSDCCRRGCDNGQAAQCAPQACHFFQPAALSDQLECRGLLHCLRMPLHAVFFAREIFSC